MYIKLLAFLLIATVTAQDLHLLILHNNDMHGRFQQTNKDAQDCDKGDVKCGYGGFARTAHVIKEHRSRELAKTGPPVLYLNAGDTYTGTIWFNVHRAKICADFMNLLKPDAASLGNHEFDYGPKGLLPFVENVTFPVVAANLDFSQFPQLEKYVKKSTVLDVNGHKIGIIGYLTAETETIASPAPVKFIDEVEALKQESEKLNAEGVKTIIALGHSGYVTDKKIAKEVPLVDIVVGGHTNTFLYNGEKTEGIVEDIEGPYPTMVEQESGKQVPVVQAYAYTKYVGELYVDINSDGDVTKSWGGPKLMNKDVPQETEVLNLLEKFKPEVQKYKTTVLGHSKVKLDGTSGVCRKQECIMGNFVTDSFIYYAVTNYRLNDSWTDVPIALCNGGSFRNTISAGEVTVADVAATMPFVNTLWIAEFSGAEIIAILEHSISDYGPDSQTSHGGFMHVSGLRVVFNVKKPVNKRVVSVMVRCAKCDVPRYEPIDNDQMYKVITTQFLYNGGDGYKMIKDFAKNVDGRDDNDQDAVAQFINRTSPIYPQLENRIVLISDDDDEDDDSGAANIGLASSLMLLLVTVQLLLF